MKIGVIGISGKGKSTLLNFPRKMQNFYKVKLPKDLEEEYFDWRLRKERIQYDIYSSTSYVLVCSCPSFFLLAKFERLADQL